VILFDLYGKGDITVRQFVYLMGLITGMALFLGLFTIGCGGDSSPQETVTIKIGNITDLTGPGANGMELVNMALEDIARYYNDNEVIPGVEFEVINWDGQMDPSRTIPGYEWLLNKGADFIVTCAPGVSLTLEPRVNADEEVLFTMVGEQEAIEPPGHVFCLAVIPQHEAYTLLSWIAENDWDYQSKGPAKIGAAAWGESYASGFVQAMEDYAKAHPDRFDFVGGYLTDFKFIWTDEVARLKDCDYVFPPIVLHDFARELRSVGSNARLFGGAPHTSFFPQISATGAWPAIDGMLFIYTGDWFDAIQEELEFHRTLVATYHPGEEEEIFSKAGYGAVSNYRMMFKIVEETVRKYGADGFSPGALYETAQSWSFAFDFRPSGYSFSPTKRYIMNDLCVLEASAEKEGPVRNDPNWYPLVTEP